MEQGISRGTKSGARKGAQGGGNETDSSAHQRYLKPLKCIGTGTDVAGASRIALNIGAVGIGFVLFTVS